MIMMSATPKMQYESNQPKWLLELENRKRERRLAHEQGAGAPCLKCHAGCPGLDLHFWRKLCKNCKCSRDDHNVSEDEFPQFDLLLGTPGQSERTCLVLRMNDSRSDNEKIFEWSPPDITRELAVDYMRALPEEILPIKGTTGAALRKRQLQKQLPLHDIDYKMCDELTDFEKKQFEKYLEGLKKYVGQGKVHRIVSARPFELPLQTPTNASECLTPKRHSKLLSSQPLITLRTPSSFISKSEFPPQSLSQSRETLLRADEGSGFIIDSDTTSKMDHIFIASSPRSVGNVDDEQPDFRESDTVSRKIAIEMQPTNVHSNYFHHINESAVPQENQNVDASFKISDGTSSKMDIERKTLKNGDTECFDLAEMTKLNLLDPHGSENATCRIDNHLSLAPISVQSSSYYSDTCYIDDPPHSSESQNSEDILEQRLSRSNLEIIQPHWGALELPIEKVSCVFPNQYSLDCTKPTFIDHTSESTALLPGTFHRKGVVKSSLNANELMSIREKLETKHRARDESNAYDIGHGCNSGSRTEDMIGFEMQDDTHHFPGNSINSNVDPTMMQTHMISHRNLNNLVTKSVGHNDSIIPNETANEPNMSTDYLKLTNDKSIRNQCKGNRPRICFRCTEAVNAGDVIVTAEKVLDAVWHPACFVCCTCKELLVDLVYFHYKGNIYCARDLANLMGIPRCFACDELIFVREYTVAEGHNYHVKHFCCWDCDGQLAGKQYVSENDRPLCLQCYQKTYAKLCCACNKVIAADQQGVRVKSLDFHANDQCFCCYNCNKILINGRIAVRENRLFCTKDCIIVYLNESSSPR